jgi:hypothetical protein
MRTLPAALGAVLLAGCTTVGVHDRAALDRVGFGPPVSLSVCAYLDDGIGEETAAALLDRAWGHEGETYGLRLRLARAIPWKRPAFGADGIMAALAHEPVLPGCDRTVAFVGRHAGDVLWGLLLPQALGAVDAATRCPSSRGPAGTSPGRCGSPRGRGSRGRPRPAARRRRAARRGTRRRW